MRPRNYLVRLISSTVFQALQAPTCHENMVKVGAYILGEFGNLIAGDERSGYVKSSDFALSPSDFVLKLYLKEE